MTRVRFRSWGLLAGALALTLALAGCGGDDNGGVDQSVHDMALQELADARAEVAAEHEHAEEAEAEAMAAMAAQAMAEAEAAAAMAAQMEAEAQAAEAMAAQMAAEAAQAMAEAMAAEATAAKLIAEAASAQAMADLSQAQDDLDAAEMALDAANAAKVAAETAQAVAESKIEAAEMAKMDAEGKANMYKQAADDATAKADMYKKAAADAEAAKMAAEDERDKYKDMYEKAVEVPTVGTQAGAESRAIAERIEKASDGAEISASTYSDTSGVNFEISENSVPRLTAPTDATDTDAPPLTGWHGSSLYKSANGVTAEALVYTDVQSSVTPFSSKYPYTVNDMGSAGAVDSNTHFYAEDLFPAGATEARKLTITGRNAADKISITHAVSSANTKQEGVTSIRGSYDGVDGTYMCMPACDIEWKVSGVTLMAVARDIDGTSTNPTVDNAHLLFQADNIEDLIPDPDHLTFGVWMQVPDDRPSDGFIGRIAKANAAKFTQENLKALISKATYTGNAAGYYATRAPGKADAESGRFTATATLTANFDSAVAQDVPQDKAADATFVDTDLGLTTPLNPEGFTSENNRVLLGASADTIKYFKPAEVKSGVSLKGTIDAFMSEDGTTMDGWIVNLGLTSSLMIPSRVEVEDADSNGIQVAEVVTAFNEALQEARDASLFEGTTSGRGGAHEWKGKWNATLHGNNTATHPTGVVGTFQAVDGMAQPEFVEGAINLSKDPGFIGVTGAFGARR